MSNNGKAGLPTIAEQFGNARSQYVAHVDARYRMSKQDRLTRHFDGYPEGVSADHNIESEEDYFLMVERARELDREDVVAGATVSRLCNNVVQNGFRVTQQTEDETLDNYIALRWNDWCNARDDCDAQGQFTFHELAYHAMRDAIVAGDIIALKTTDGRVQLVENHRIKTPNNLKGDAKKMTLFGVEVDGARRRKAYWLTEDDIQLDRFVGYEDSRRVPAYGDNGQRQVLHIMHPKRITQTRGVTKFAPISTACAMHDDVQYAKLVQQQSVSVWTMYRERPMGFEAPPNSIDVSRIERDPNSPGSTRPIRNLAAGMIYTGYPGEKVGAFPSNVPNPTFFDHAKQIQQLIAINLDVPLVLLLLDASETNFSGWRGALEQAKVAYRQLQCWLAQQFHDPIYLWKLRQWSDPASPFADPYLVAARAAGVDIFAREWVYPTWTSTEPLKDSSDRLLRYANNMASLRRIMAETGIDYDRELTDVIEDRVKLIERSIEAAEGINKRYPNNPQPITWMNVASHALPEGFTFSLQNNPDTSSQESSDGDR